VLWKRPCIRGEILSRGAVPHLFGFIFLLTAEEEFDANRLELLLYRHSTHEVDVALTTRCRRRH
jgi:hypothetical protein